MVGPKGYTPPFLASALIHTAIPKRRQLNLTLTLNLTLYWATPPFRIMEVNDRNGDVYEYPSPRVMLVWLIKWKIDFSTKQ